MRERFEAGWIHCNGLCTEEAAFSFAASEIALDRERIAAWLDGAQVGDLPNAHYFAEAIRQGKDRET
jgi:hypothetical protein